MSTNQSQLFQYAIKWVSMIKYSFEVKMSLTKYDALVLRSWPEEGANMGEGAVLRS